jgi:ABC-2 type transport system permease protein
MLRYARLYACFVRFSFSRAMEFRFDFFFRVVMDCVFYATQLLFFRLIYLQSPLIAGWTEPQAMIFVSGYLFVDAVHMTIFSNNVWWLPVLINRGDLDYYLVRPVSSLFFLTFRDFAANSFVNLLFSVGILGWAIARYPGELGAARVATYVALLLVGTGIMMIVSILVKTFVFWTHSPNGFEQAYHTVIQYSERPDGIFTGWVRRVLTSILPVCLVASFPARALFEGPSAGLLLHVGVVAVAMFALLLATWSAGLRVYSSASS